MKTDGISANACEVIQYQDRTELGAIRGFKTEEMGNSVYGSLTRAYEAVGCKVPYADVLGFTGQAFRIQEGKMCPSSPHSSCGYATGAAWDHSAPLNAVPIAFDSKNPESVRKLREAVKAQIDAGWPLLYGTEESGLIVGYVGKGEKWICLHPYHGEDRFVTDEIPWGVKKLVPNGNPELRSAAMKASLLLAVRMWDALEADGYLLGPKAWSHWVEWAETATDKDAEGGRQGNFWIYDQLVAGRRSAAEFLRNNLDLAPKDARPELSLAADAYDQLVSTMTPEGSTAAQITIPKWAEKDGLKFGSDSRKREAVFLRKAWALDREAITHIRTALDAFTY